MQKPKTAKDQVVETEGGRPKKQIQRKGTRGTEVTRRGTGMKEIKEKKEAKKRWDLTGPQEDRETYKMRKKNAKRAVASSKAKAIEEAYEEIEKKNGERQMLRIAKARDRASKDITIVRQMKDTSGVVLREDDKIRSRWKEYFHKLLNEENPRVRDEDGEATEGVVKWSAKQRWKQEESQMKLSKKCILQHKHTREEAPLYTTTRVSVHRGRIEPREKDSQQDLQL
ncbi:hypothetical protein J437_LFUL008078 [Ladona fulva]|uniref:Uncharacterized protein n=1 Tax=Ladona fulva TaxID=123851 RepID=A0A8K0KBV1_LADFU|nr:hypothetical protein J437_LFUL008078 [Ladona fulva]